jgi:hypothetical protein
MRYHLLPRRPAVKWVASTARSSTGVRPQLVSGLLQTEGRISWQRRHLRRRAPIIRASKTLSRQTERLLVRIVLNLRAHRTESATAYARQRSSSGGGHVGLKCAFESRDTYPI